MKNVYEYYDSVEKHDVEWLWYPYITYGKLTLLEGDPGEGKSTLMLHIAARLTRGKYMPDGFSISEPVSVIYQCAEDDVSDTIKPRLVAADADCSKVAYILYQSGSLTINDERIESVLNETKARLLVLDTFQSLLMQDGDLHSVGRMRTTLSNLARIAAKYRCAVVLIGHMNKSNGSKSLYRGLGSIDIAAIARSVLMVERDEEQSEMRYMIPIKSSLAPEGKPVTFRLSRNNGFQWLRNYKAENNLKEKKFELIQRCSSIEVMKYLSELLSDEPMPSVQLLRETRKLGVSDRTVYKVKKEMEILSVKINNIWYWKFPDENEG